ncbi:MAG: ribosome hibernation-promoting factor, HPF/YfiA family [Candidatus Goldiibacteriota bacterium]
MKFNMTGRHITLTKGIKDYTKKRFKKLEEYFDFKQNGELHIVIDVQKYRHLAEANLVSKKHNFTAKVETKDMYASIDKLETKLVGQIKKHKDKLIKPEKKKDKKTAVLDNIVSADSMSGENYHEVVEEDLEAVKPMNTEEAIEELGMSKEKIFMFYNVDFNKTCILRKRKDGKYGMTISKY